MNYFLYQLQFNTAVHFGGSESALSLYHSEHHFRADTLFSALCHTALQLDGESGLNRLLELARKGELLLSDAMPWKEEQYYLPKPIFSPDAAPELPGEKRKLLKKLAWIPAVRFEDYCMAVKTGVLLEMEPVRFGFFSDVTKAAVPEFSDAMPYQVGLYRFHHGCGLWFLAACPDDRDSDWLSSLICALGLTGIGGKVSAGYGKYTVSDQIYLNEFFDTQTDWLYTALTRNANASMLLTTSLPADGEMDTALDGAYYQLTRRGGFVASNTYAPTPRKKQTQYFLSAGSVLKNRYRGEVYRIGAQGNHPVLRYSKPIFLGVNL